MNNDGRDDIVTAFNESVTVLLSNFDGSMNPPRVVASPGNYTLAVVPVDLNEDGKIDLVTSHNGSITVFLASDHAVFIQPGAEINTAVNGKDIAAGDFDGDGHQDVVVGGSSNDAAQVFYGNGFGGLTSTIPWLIGASPMKLAVADFDGDGIDDLASANSGSAIEALTVLVGGSGRRFYNTEGTPYSLPHAPRWITTGDFNGDGHPDLAAISNNSETVNVLINLGNGEFSTETDKWFSSPSGMRRALASADFNQDGLDDLILGRNLDRNTREPTVPIFLASATQFTEAPGSPWLFTEPSYPWYVATGDFNADGLPDFASGDQANRVTVFIQESDDPDPEPEPCPTGPSYPFTKVGGFSGSKSGRWGRRPGVRIQVRADGTFEGRLDFTATYRTKKGKRTTPLRSRDMTINGQKRLRIPLPGNVKKALRKRYGKVRGAPLTIRITGTLAPADRADCSKAVKPARLKTRAVVIGRR